MGEGVGGAPRRPLVGNFVLLSDFFLFELLLCEDFEDK